MPRSDSEVSLIHPVIVSGKQSPQRCIRHLAETDMYFWLEMQLTFILPLVGKVSRGTMFTQDFANASTTGLNLGLCDAISLGEVLAKHITNHPPDETNQSLEKWNADRRVVVERVVALAGRLSYLLWILGVPGVKPVLKLLLSQVINRLEFIKGKAIWNISGMVNKA